MTKTQTKTITAQDNEPSDINLKNEMQFVNVEKIVKNEKDILFVKYDAVNMRYLYKCCVCATHWKNKE